MKNALVTGATGYIGKNLAEKLHSLGVKTTLLLREQSDTARLGPLADYCKIFRHDGSYGSIKKPFESEKIEIVFHLASHVAGTHDFETIRPMFESNLTFGTLLLEAMTNHNCFKLINTGSYWQHYQNEDYNPVSLYAATKQAFEVLSTYYVEAEKLQVINLKLFDVYGPDDWRGKIFSLLEKAHESHNEIELSAGEQLIDLLHIDDVVDAYVAAANLLLASKDFKSDTFFVSSNQQRSLREIINLFVEITKNKAKIAWGARPYREREVMKPYDKGATLPGWSAKISIEEGFKSIVEK